MTENSQVTVMYNMLLDLLTTIIQQTLHEGELQIDYRIDRESK